MRPHSASGPATRQHDHVNFILINLDDAGNGDFSFSGALGYQTPNIDRLACEGMRYTQFYAAQPISGASRAGLLTGCYPKYSRNATTPLPSSGNGIWEMRKNSCPFSTDSTICERLASNIDILPTFAEIAEAERPSHKIDGVSLLPLLQNPEASPVRKALCLYYQENSLEAVTDGTYKLIFPHDYLGYGEPGNDGRPGKMIPRRVEKPELYDMRRDPGERYDISAQHPDVVRRLEKFADSCRADLGKFYEYQQKPPPKHGIQIDIC